MYKHQKDNYAEMTEFLSAQFEQINGFDYYLDIFPNNEKQGDMHTDFSHPNAIFVYKDDSLGKKRTKVMFNDTWEDDYLELIECQESAICGGLSYRGKRNLLEKAQRLHAFMFDLDEVGADEIRTLFLRFGNAPDTVRALPYPTYVVCSGTGLHVVYVLDVPIDLYPNIKLQAKAFKYALTEKMWEYKGTTRLKAKQYQSINQGYRMVGSVNEKHGKEVVAFRTGEKVSLEYLNSYVSEESRIDVLKPFRPSKMTRAQAKENFPEWYERVIVKGDKRPKKWDIRGKSGTALYDWWLSQADKVEGGHRFYFLMCMSIYAAKVDIPKSQLKKDMYEIFEKLKTVAHKNPLTEEDIESALEVYSKEYYNFTLDDIEKLCGWQIPRNKRNGRKQKDHIRRITLLRDDDYPDGTWRNKDGRPDKKTEVALFRHNNPNASKAECIRATGLSKPTVYKWWDEVAPAHIDYSEIFDL